MTTVADIAAWMETLAPVSRKMSWDNCGLLCGRKEKTVRRILVALDPFEAVAAEASRIGADMIVTHHPIIFQPIYAVTDETGVGRSLQILIRNDIAALNAHTNLDIAPGGVNDALAQALGLKAVTVIDPVDMDENGNAWGLLRSGSVEPQSLESFLAFVKERLNTPVLRYCEGGKTVHRVAVGGGACADEFMSALHAGCDTFVTSDAKYNDFWDAHDSGLNLIDAGHFYTENPICAVLVEKLRSAFPEIEVIPSSIHRDCMKFFG